MTYFKRKIKIVNNLVNVTLSNIGILFHSFPGRLRKVPESSLHSRMLVLYFTLG